MEYTPRELAIKLAQSLDERKAQHIAVIDVAGVTEFADYFVICTGNSSTQVKALADEAEFKLKQDGVLPDHVEGHDGRSWIVLDYISVVCHVFDTKSRDFYDLERLWSDGKRLAPEEWQLKEDK